MVFRLSPAEADAVWRAKVKKKTDLKARLKSLSLGRLSEIQQAVQEELQARKMGAEKIRHVITYTDGASRGNPGPAGIGVLIYNDKDEKLFQECEFIGKTTNNEAEYRALLLALDRAYEFTPESVECFLDSELLVRQMNGQYAVKSEKMARFHQEAKRRAGRFGSIRFVHVPREHPKLRLADKLANKAIDEAK